MPPHPGKPQPAAPKRPSRPNVRRSRGEPSTSQATAAASTTQPAPLDTVTQRLVGLTLLFSVVGWWLYLHVPALAPGFLDAGDDHVHVAFENELARIWRDAHQVFGWNRLYATGAPMFLLRPPGLYFAVVLCHFVSGLPIEQAHKLVVV